MPCVIASIPIFPAKINRKDSISELFYLFKVVLTAGANIFAAKGKMFLNKRPPSPNLLLCKRVCGKKFSFYFNMVAIIKSYLLKIKLDRIIENYP